MKNALSFILFAPLLLFVCVMATGKLIETIAVTTPEMYQAKYVIDSGLTKDQAESVKLLADARKVNVEAKKQEQTSFTDTVFSVIVIIGGSIFVVMFFLCFFLFARAITTGEL